ncbi:MAG: VWA domain-containing protein [Planctomycetota bacterium]
MDHEYSAFDGQPFLSPDQLFPEPAVMDFLLKYGDDALDALQNMEGDDEQELIQQMLEAGLLEEYQDENGNTRLRLTPRMLQGMQHRCLEEVFENLKKGSRDGHRSPEIGKTTERTEGTKAYAFGDPLSDVDLGATMRNAMSRQRPPSGKTPLPLDLNMNDFELHQTEGSADCATVFLIDLSGSMYRYGRFIQAKRVALGMQALIRGRFPLDTIDYVTFYSLAESIQEKDLPLVMPKPVTIHDYEVKLRVPLEQAYGQKDRLPLHFTNLHLGLREARRVLARRGAVNKQIFVITDGQPTAHAETSPETGEEMLYLLYPPTTRTRDITLQEAMKCQQSGIRIATFALIEDYFGMDWVGFVDHMTRLTRGVAYYCTSEDLGSTIVESYLTGKKKKTFVH